MPSSFISACNMPIYAQLIELLDIHLLYSCYAEKEKRSMTYPLSVHIHAEMETIQHHHHTVTVIQSLSSTGSKST